MKEYLYFTDKYSWRRWLEQNHTIQNGAWLVHYMKHTGKTGLTYKDAVNEALCFGWIDSLLRNIDGEKFAQRYSRRMGNNFWSESNKRNAENMIEQGLMTEAGFTKINEAKNSGHWDKTLQRESLGIPADLQRAFAANTTAWVSFQKLPPSDQRQLVRQVKIVKKPGMRQQRIKQVIMFAMQRQSVNER